MPRFEVTWVIDSDETSPQAAAREALAIQRRTDSTAPVFKVNTAKLAQQRPSI